MNEIELKNMSIALKSGKTLVNNINLKIEPGHIIGLVGESGSGKSLTGKSLARLNDEQLFTYSGEILFNQENILDYSNQKLRNYYRHNVSMIFQDPMNSLNPLSTIRKQIYESIRMNRSANRVELKHQSEELLLQSGFRADQVDQVLGAYPHELSGGMQQRVMIALAIAKNPSLLIADEPTTALDVTIQANIIRLLQSLNKKFDLSILFITHDLSVAQKLCDHIAVMRQGEIVEYAPTEHLFTSPMHPYTINLFESIPGLTESQRESLQKRKEIAEKYRRDSIEKSVGVVIEVSENHWFKQG